MNILPAALIAGLAASPALAETRGYAFENFTGVAVSAGVDAEIGGGDFAVTGEARRGDLDRLSIRQDGDMLIVTREHRFRPFGGLFGLLRNDDFNVTISMPELARIEAMSGSDVHTTAPSAATLDASSHSGATLEVREIDTGRLTGEAGSGASLMLSGEADEVRLSASSGASLDATGACGMIIAESSSGASLHAEDMHCARGDLGANSGADVRAYISEEGEASANSGGSINIYGGGEINADENSGGSVRERG
ncbi:GIN domain-containing protein [Pseudoroseicyclus sp. CXY001]|uniref:GIN domain-containing protein n=1 Tax=Pseudoroseicyclus sp. CXY001 TaxID=3242492 RepID=UPI00358DB00A